MTPGLPPPKPSRRCAQQWGYDPKAIAARWDLHYSEGNSVVRPFYRDPRIVVPLYSIENGPVGEKVARLAGWEALALTQKPNSESDGWPPDVLYSKGLEGDTLLYGLHSALKTSGPLVVVRRIADAWRLETNVVAYRLSTLSYIQTYYIARNFRHRPVVILLPCHSRAKSQEIADKIRTFRKRECDPAPVLIAQVPRHRWLVRKCTTQEAWAAVSSALERADAGLDEIDG